MDCFMLTQAGARPPYMYGSRMAGWAGDAVRAYEYAPSSDVEDELVRARAHRGA